jgi:predicted N-acetyltransferase YhbS
VIDPRVVRNIRVTYEKLAHVLPETKTYHIPSGTMTVSAIRHPIANFAVVDQPEKWEAVPIPGPFFHVYAMQNLDQTVEIPGYRMSYELILMVHPLPETWRYAPPLKVASQPKERLAVARFMTRQFFANANRETSDRICAVTSGPNDLELAAFQGGWPSRIEAAVMLSPSDGVLGLYNLCVEAKLRRQGRGEQIVRKVVQMAASDHRVCALQCDPRLEAWYAKLGFIRVGTMGAWVPLEE